MAAKKGGSGTRKLPKSAVTGKIVTKAYAKSHPKTTFLETVPRTGKKPKGRGK
ncbi:MAG: hypothetical protein ACXWJH_07510 [Hyphomicrobium sp.]